MTEFAEFLKQSSTIKIGNEPLYLPGGLEHHIFWMGPGPLQPRSLLDTENVLNCRFPEGYRVFMETLGPCVWADAFFAPPAALYAFDEDTLDMCGFITLAFGVDGCGNYVAFNPREPERIYFCCHDPFGYAVVAESFEEYIRKLTEFAISHKGGGSFYYDLEPFHEIRVPKSESSGKPWWQFWK